jgi:hypothetical protein
MRNYLSIFIIPVLASCTTMQSAKSVEVSEVITADLARADGSWAGVATISQRTFMRLENAKRLTSQALVRTGTPI